MNKNDFQQNRLAQAVACVLAIGSMAWVHNSDAATATVLESVSVIVIAPEEVVTTPVLAGTVFTINSFTESLSTSNPLLRSAPPPADVVSGTGGAGAPPAADSAAVVVTVNADGSLSVSGGSNLMFALAQPADGAVIIEYN